MKKSIAALALIAGLPMAAGATEIYGGLGLGYADLETTHFVGEFNDTISDDDMSSQVFLGLQLSEAVAIELAYVDFGSFKKDFGEGDTAKVEPTALQFTVLGRMPITKGWNLFGRVGISYLNTDYKENVTGTGNFSDTENSQDLVLGGGVDWDVMDHVRVRFEANWLDAEDTSQFTNYMLSGIYSFDL